MSFSVDELNQEICYLWVTWWETDDPDEANKLKVQVKNLQEQRRGLYRDAFSRNKTSQGHNVYRGTASMEAFAQRGYSRGV